MSAVPAGPRAHPWNTDFAWVDHTGPFAHLTAAEVAQFDADGYVLVPDLLTADEVAATVDALDRLEAEVDAFLQTQENGRFSIAETGALTVTPARGHPLGGAARGEPAPPHRRHLRRSRGT